MKQRCRVKYVACICLAWTLALGAFGVHALADAGSSSGINYSVRAILPENQRDVASAYFDLLVSPGQEQILEVIIQNKAQEDIQVAVEANPAHSNVNGVIEFDAKEVGSDVALRFAQTVTPIEPVITVPANGHAIAQFQVRMPEEPYEGVLYGGLMFTKLNQTEDSDGAKGGFGIRNVYRYVLGVRLWEDDTRIEPDFELQSAQMSVDNANILLLHLHNLKPVIVRGMSLSIRIEAQGAEKPPITLERNNLAMAPLSSMPYALYLDRDMKLETGTYKVSVALEYEDALWELEAPLTIP